MIRARIVEGVLAAVGMSIAALPLTSLLMRGTWLWMLLGVIGTVAVSGILLRALGAPAGLVLMAQLLLVVAVAAVLHVHHLGWSETPAEVQGLFTQAAETIRRYAAPAPVTRGLSFALVLIVGVLAVCADGTAATVRSPAVAGLPLLTTLLLSTSNTAVALNPGYFVGVTIAWMALVAHSERLGIQRSISMVARPTVPAEYDQSRGRFAQASSARVLGSSTLLIALIAASVLPHMAPRFLTDGLGRGTSAGPGTVSFNTTLDLTRNLASRNQAAVLRYTSTDPSPPPLKVVLANAYVNGVWSSQTAIADETPTNNNEQLTRFENLLNTFTYQSDFTENSLNPPQLAAPGGVESGDLGASRWSYSPSTGRILPATKADSYSLTYAAPGNDDRPVGRRDVPTDPSDLSLPISQGATQRLRAIIAGFDTTDEFELAQQMQAYFRGNNGFTYSLSLSPTQRVAGQPLDPLSNFLETKQGYCVQYATAMVMMARLAGIPARLAIGFLPGSKNSRGVWQVRQADAHAWPELSFPGMGWTRFEPTPAARTGTAPGYTIDPRVTSTPSATATPTTSAQPSSSAAPAPTPTSTQPRGGGGLELQTIATLLLYAVLALAALFVLACALPALARRRDRRLRAEAVSSQQRVEAEWHTLQSRLQDLGHPPATGQSPRRALEHYANDAALTSAARTPLNQAIALLERSRYAPPSQDAAVSIEELAQSALDAARRASTTRQRLSSRLWPRAGVAELATLTTQFTNAITRTMRNAAATVFRR